MEDALTIHRLHFGFTVTYHYLFPQLTMGLAPLIVIFKALYVWKGNEAFNTAARFWIRIFAINFLFGVVTGIPMEFQFGTNWAQFSQYAGGVIATALAMEGVFAFFLESSFLGILVFGEKRFGQKMHLFAAVMVFVGSWLSGYFIIVTDAWMQRPVGYETGADGTAHLVSFTSLIFSDWAFWQYLHNMGGAAVTGSFLVAAVGAYYVLSNKFAELGRLFLKVGVIAAAVASAWQLWPTGDRGGKLVAEHQPVTLAAMEGHFHTQPGAPIVLIGQPDMQKMELDNAIYVPKALSFLTYQRWEAVVQGLDAFPPENWPDNVPLLYYSYHIMVGLGTIFIAVMLVSLFLLWRGALFGSRWMLWILMLSFPFPYIANTAGWMTAELGRQPWIIYNLMRTSEGFSHNVSSGNGLFTLLGFLGMYTVLSIVFLFLIWHEISHGPRESESENETPPSARIMPDAVET